MNFDYVDQAVASGIILGVTIIVFGWVAHSVFFGVQSVEEKSSPVRWGDD